MINYSINKLLIERHLPGYRFCGRDTKLAKRLARGDNGKTMLDEACKDHGIAYSQKKEILSAKYEADRRLKELASQRVKPNDAIVLEKRRRFGS